MNSLKQLLDAIPTQEMSEYKGALEEYLISLWTVIQEMEREQPSPSLIYKALVEATRLEPVQFDASWMRYEAPPYQFDSNQQGEFEYLKETLLFQIADLRRMKEAGILNLSPVTLYGGVQSPTNHSWYNFSVVDYFKCAVSGFGSHCESYNVNDELTGKLEKIERPIESKKFSWRDLTELLEFGRVYE